MTLSFRGGDHLRRIQEEARALVSEALVASTSTISRRTPFITSAKADAEPTIPEPTIPIFTG